MISTNTIKKSFLYIFWPGPEGRVSENGINYFYSQSNLSSLVSFGNNFFKFQGRMGLIIFIIYLVKLFWCSFIYLKQVITKIVCVFWIPIYCFFHIWILNVQWPHLAYWPDRCLQMREKDGYPWPLLIFVSKTGHHEKQIWNIFVQGSLFSIKKDDEILSSSDSRRQTLK